jgi:hypothetical protein
VVGYAFRETDPAAVKVEGTGPVYVVNVGNVYEKLYAESDLRAVHWADLPPSTARNPRRLTLVRES